MNRRRVRALERDLKAVGAEGNGLWQISVVSAEMVPEMWVAAAAGEPKAMQLLLAVRRALEKRGRDPLVCLLCEQDFANAMPAAVVLVEALEGGQNAIANMVCRRCFDSQPLTELGQRIVDFYRQNLMPDARIVHPMPTPERMM